MQKHPDERLTELLERALEALENGGEPALATFVESVGEAGPLIHAKVNALRGAGLLDAEAPPPRPGTPDHFGDYRILEKIGEGGMGVVYLAEHRALGRRVALKAIRHEHMLFDTVRERFRREVEVIARLRHPGIVPIHAVGERDGVPWFAMEYVDGSSLGEVLRSLQSRDVLTLTGSDLARIVSLSAHTRPDSSTSSGYMFDGSWPDTCCKLLRQAADALQHAHQKGVVHRDVKPSNLMITPTGHVLLLDFGLAQAEGVSPLTRSGVELGTLPYLAPEQIDSARGEVGPRTDVYGLGVTLYELLALKLPFDQTSPEPLRRAILAGRPPRLRERNSNVSWELETVCATAMEPDPARRYATVADFARDLDHVLMRRPVEARRPGVWLRTRRWIERNPASATAAALLSILLIGGPTVYGIQQHQSLVALEAIHRRTDGLRLAANAQSHLRLDPPLALRLALEAHERAPGLISRNAVYAALAASNEILSVGGGGAAVSDTAFGLGDSLVLSVWSDGALRATDVVTGQLKYWVHAHDARVTTLDVSPDGATALTASSDGTFALWSVADGSLVRRIQDEPRSLLGAHFSPDGGQILVWRKRGGVSLHSSATGEHLIDLVGHTQDILGTEWCKAGARILTRSADQTARVWDAQTGACLAVFSHKDMVVDASISPGGEEVVTAEREGPARVWSVKSQSPVRTLEEDGLPIPLSDMVAYSPDGELLFVVSRDHDVRVYRAADGVVVSRLRGHDRLVKSASWSPDSRRIATAGDDRTVRLWNAKTGDSLLVLAGHTTTIRTLTFSEDGEKLASASSELKCWSAPQSRLFSPDQHHTSKMTRCYFSADGALVTTAAHDGFGRVFNWRTARENASFGPQDSAVTVVDVHPGTERAVAGTFSGVVGVYDLHGKLLREISAHGYKVGTASFSPDGATLLTTGSDRQAKLWNVQTGECLHTLDASTDLLTRGAFSADGSLVVTGDRSGDVKVHEVASGKCLQTFRAHKRVVQCANFDDSGKFVITGSHDRTVVVWDWREARAVHTLSGHPDFVWAARMSHNGLWVATGGADRQLRLWNAATGALEAELSGPVDLISDIAFLNHDQTVAAVAARGGVYTWSVDALTVARQSNLRSLTVAEASEFGIGSPESLRAAQEWVERVRPACALVADLRARLDRDSELSEEVRRAARELVARLEDSPRELVNAAWPLCMRPGGLKEDYARALRMAEEAVRRAPHSKDFVRTLGVARYRNEDYTGAVELLSREELIQFCDGSEEASVTLSFLALAQARSGAMADAARTFAQARGAVVGNAGEYLTQLLAEAEEAVR